MSRSRIHQLDAYNYRDIASLPEVFPKWSESFRRIQRAHNRILQPGFMYRNTDEVLADAKIAGIEWLTNVCCPSAKADIMLHIGKEMVVNYQVADKELNIKAHQVYASLVGALEGPVFEGINETVDLKMAEVMGKESARITKTAQELLVKNFREKGLKSADITPEQFGAAQRLVLDMERRKIMDTIVPGMVKEHLKSYANSLGLVNKTRYPIGKTHDFFYGGPAGSGKSTLSRKDLSEKGADLNKINKIDCVTVSTDIYRVFTLPGTEEHEQIQTMDVFTRTQDFSYMIKELVLNDLRNMNEARPNLINDGVAVELEVREILKQSRNLVSKVALYRGDEAGYRGIAERALMRAQDPNADPGDKSRYIETTSLFKGHAQASQLFLYNVPENAVTEVFDTNVNREKNEEPIKVATVNSSDKTIEILNLRIMSEWLNKKNINIKAEHPVELILKEREKFDNSPLYMTDPVNKAAAIIDLTKGLKIPDKKVDIPPYTVTLKNAKGEAYASLLPGGKLSVLDLETFEKQANRASSPEAQVLRAMTLQTAEQTAALDDSPEAAAVKLVETINKNLASAYERALDKTAKDANTAAAQRLNEEDLNLEVLEDTIASLEARIDLRKEQGPSLDALETVLVTIVEVDQEANSRKIAKNLAIEQEKESSSLLSGLKENLGKFVCGVGLAVVFAAAVVATKSNNSPK